MNRDDSQFSTQQDIKASISSLSDEARAYLAKLQSIRSEIEGKLSVVEVSYLPTARPDISKAVNQIFNKETISQESPDKKAITLQMYLDCLEIIRQSGKYKAQTVLAEKTS